MTHALWNCLTLVPILLIPMALNFLAPPLPAASLCPRCTLALIALVANLVLRQEPGKETHLPAEHASPCWGRPERAALQEGVQGIPQPSSFISQTRRWRPSEAVCRWTQSRRVTEPGAKPGLSESPFNVNYTRLCWGRGGGGRIETIKIAT